VPAEIARELPAAIRAVEAEKRKLIECCHSREFGLEGLLALQDQRRGVKH
jgi:hypothetical protein